MTEQPLTLRIGVAAADRMDLHGLIEAAQADHWQLTRVASVPQLVALAEAGQCDAAIVVTDAPCDLPRAAVQDLLGRAQDIMLVLMLPIDSSIANCPAILGATSDQIWDIHTPPQEVLSALRPVVETIVGRRPVYEVLCVDDDPEFLASLKRLLAPATKRPLSQFTLDFSFTSSPSEALTYVETLDKPLAVIVCDQVMPQMQGMDLLSQLKASHPLTRRVLLTGYAGLESAVRAVNEQLLDKYFTKPVEQPSEFVSTVIGLAREYHHQSMAAQHRRLMTAQFEFLQAMTGAGNLATALDTTTNFLLTQLGAPWVALFSLEEEKFVPRSVVGQSPPSPEAIGRAWRHHFSYCSFCQRMPDVLRNCCADSDDTADPTPAYVATVVPLIVRQEVMGALVVGADKTDQMLTLVERLLAIFVADIAAITITQFKDRETLESTYVGTMASLMDIVEAKDPYTRGHTDRVVTLTMAMAKAAGIGKGSMKDIRYAAALHDVGKLAVPEGILCKPGRLNLGEQAIVMEHPARADTILKHLRFLNAARLIIRSHHEWFNGRGYPDHLTGEEIPLGARILAIVDAYDAMTSKRPYRRAMTAPQALAEIQRGAGTQFDPALAALFVEMMRTSEKIQPTAKQGSAQTPVEV
jgi:response regulator RpfG family c-di-GMP phosphodiesterase